MANRTVSVELKLAAEQYKREAEEAKLKTEGLDRAVTELDRDVKKIPTDAEKAALALKMMGTEAGSVGDKFQSIGDRSTALRVLDQRIKESQAEVRKLGEEFVKTGDVDVFRKLGNSDSALRGLRDLRKSIVGVVEDAGDEGGQGFVRRFTNKIGGGADAMTQGLSNIPWAGIIFKPLAAAMGAVPPEVQIAIGGIIVTGIAASAALIGAALNGVLLAGVGLGGIGLGIAAQFSNPLVHNAFAALGTDIMSQFRSITDVFVNPLVQSARIFGAAWQSMLPGLRVDFEALSKMVAPLASGLAGLFTSMAPGLGEAFAAAGPVLREFSAQLPGLGSAISDMFSSLAGGQKGAIEGLRTLFDIIDGTIRGVGNVVGVLSQMYSWLIQADGAMAGFLAKVYQFVPLGGVLSGFFTSVQRIFQGLAGETLPGVGRALDGVTIKMDDMGTVGGTVFYGISQRIQDSVDTVKRLNKEFDTARNELLGLRNANIDAAQAAADLAKGFKRGADQLNINTQLGRDNERLINTTIAAYGRQRDAAIAAGGGTRAAYDAATSAYNNQIRHLEDLLVKLGISRRAAHDFLAEFVDKTVTVTVKIHQVGAVSQQGVVTGGVPLKGGYAEGGPVMASGMYKVGEQGPEIRWLNAGDYMFNAPDSSRMLAGMRSAGSVSGATGTGSASSGASTFQLVVGSAGGGFERALAATLNEMARTGRLQLKAA